MLRVGYYLLILLVLYSCRQKSSPKAASKIQSANEYLISGFQKTETCTRSKDHSYELYIPESNQSCEKLPLWIILSPHGDGAYALSYFKNGAGSYPCILAASNLIRNNYADHINGIQTLIDDIRQKYPVDDRVYLAGFSGAARMCLNYASVYPVDGVIVCGGLTDAGQLGKIKTDVLSIAGLADFNFLETAQFLFMKNGSTNLSIELTSQKHEWPDEENIKRGMAYFLLRSTDKMPCISQSEFTDFCTSEKNRIEECIQVKKYFQAELIRKKMGKIANCNISEDFNAYSIPSLFRDGYSSEQMQLLHSLQMELALREDYSAAMRQLDTIWWKGGLEALNEMISSDEDLYRRFTYIRIKAYLGILCYSLADMALRGNRTTEARKILTIYRMVEPQNPDMLYFSALLAMQTGQEGQSKKMLVEALGAGYHDFDRIKNEFPEGFIPNMELGISNDQEGIKTE